jgi:hypothetical protein
LSIGLLHGISVSSDIVTVDGWDAAAIAATAGKIAIHKAMNAARTARPVSMFEVCSHGRSAVNGRFRPVAKRCPLWVISGRCSRPSELLLYPPQRTSSPIVVVSAKCQFRTCDTVCGAIARSLLMPTAQPSRHRPRLPGRRPIPLRCARLSQRPSASSAGRVARAQA